MDARLSQVRQLCLLTLDQIEAARSLQVERLSSLNLARTDLLFSLRTELEAGGAFAGEDRRALQQERQRLERLERRLQLVCGSVLQALSLGSMSENRTYSRLRHNRGRP